MRQICRPVSTSIANVHLPLIDVHDAVVDRRRGQLALVVHQARAPDRHQPLDVGFVDLLERAVALAVVAHALGGDVVGVLAVVDQFLRRLRERSERGETE